MTQLKNLNLRMPSGPMLYSLIAGALIVFLVFGYLFFIRLSIMPQLQVRDELVSGLAAAKKQAREAESTRQVRPNKAQEQAATAQAALNESLSVFLTDGEAATVLDNLYAYADETGVEILDLQALPTPQAPAQQQPAAPPPTPLPPLPPATTAAAQKATATPRFTPTPLASPTPTPSPTPKVELRSVYEVRPFRLQVRGDMPKLVAFVSRIKEASVRSCAIANVSIVEAEGHHLLTMDISLYTSSYAPTSTGPAAVATRPPPRTASPGTLPSPNLAPTVQPGLVRPTNWPTNEPWPPDTRATPSQSALPTARAPTVTPGGATPSATSASHTEYIIYTVRRGDTLYSIARRYGTTVDAIMAANGLTDSQIRVGQQLRIPR